MLKTNTPNVYSHIYIYIYIYMKIKINSGDDLPFRKNTNHRKHTNTYQVCF